MAFTFRARLFTLALVSAVVCSVVVSLGLLELGVRASTWTWLFAWPNYVLDARKVLAETDRGRSVHDERLGYRLTGDTLPFPYGNPRFGLPKRDDLYFVVMERGLD